MQNFFLDNEDILFLFRHFDWRHLASIVEEDFRFADEFDIAPRDADEAVDNYEMMLTQFGELAAKEIAPTAEETDRIGCTLNEDGTVSYAPGTQKAMELISESGMMGTTLPYRYGGLNCPDLFLTITNDLISRADASLMNLYGLQGIGETINEFGDDELKQEYLDDMASGRKSGAMVLTEPEAGSDLQAVRVEAQEEKDGGWRINGVKRFITNGCGEVLLVLARSEPDIPGGRGLSLFLVERGPWVKVVRLEEKMGIHGSPTCELAFTDAPAKLVGERQQGLIKYVMALMYGARIGVAAQACGIAEAAYRVAREYGNQRRQFGTTIDTFPAVREMLVESRIDLLAARALVYFASFNVAILRGAEHKLEAGELADEEEAKATKAEARSLKRITGMLTPMAKYYCAEMSIRVTNDAIAVMGGSGYMREYPLERLYRDARITSIYEGTSQLQIVPAGGAVNSGIAETLLRQTLDREWPEAVAGYVDQILAAIDELNEMIQFVKEQPDENYRRLYARRIVDNAIILIVGAMFCDHAAASPERETILKYWMATRMVEFRRNRELIMSGEQSILESFEELAGPVPTGTMSTA
jgi:alkylation response protein AidB-like acyl-CoA dehydrogenase